MLTAKAVLDWLKTSVTSPSWTCGRSDRTKAKSICVYSGVSPSAATLNVAGSTGSYRQMRFRILVRWTEDFVQASAKANEVYAVFKQSTQVMGGDTVFIAPVYDEPTSLGTDDKGVYEHVIDVRIITKK